MHGGQWPPNIYFMYFRHDMCPEENGPATEADEHQAKNKMVNTWEQPPGIDTEKTTRYRVYQP